MSPSATPWKPLFASRSPGLTSGQTYYFRTLAKNSSSTNNGEDWANSSKAFTTVTSSVREETEAVRYSDLEGWWKLDGNLNDSSGNNRHGTPPIIQTSTLWLDAADTSTNSIQLGSGNVQTWKDKSGNGHNVAQAAGGSRPSPVSNGLNGLQVLSFDGSHDHLVSTTFVLENAHSIYAVAKSDSNGYSRILNGNTDGRYLFGNGNGNNNFATLYGVSDWNSTGVITNSPAQSVASHSILVAVSDGTNVTPYHNGTAQNSMSSTMGGSAPAGITIGKHGTASSQYWQGHIAEIIIFKKNHSVNEREEVEGYLAQKWGLTGSLPSGHSSLIKYKDDTTSGFGQSLDLSNGVFATVSTGGTEDVFDGGSAFSTSMWVKGWPAVTNQSLISKDNFSPAIFGDLKSWLDANSANSLVQDSSGTPSSNNDIVFKWKDLSGNGHHASTLDTSPKLNTTGFNNKPTVEFTDDTLELDGSEAFNWDGLTVFTVWKAPQDNVWTAFFGRTKSLNHTTEATWHFIARRADRTPPKYRFRINGPSATSTPELSDTYSAQIKSNNLLVLRYNGSYQRAFLNGTSAMNIAYSGGMRPTSYKLTMGGESDGESGPTMNVSEFIVFKGALSDANVVKIEGYLAHKWGLESNLPSGHSHKSNPPIFGGWAVERASTGNDNLALNMIGAGDEFASSLPVNDNEWHHIVTTFGGGNKKIYVDGVQTSTASQSGSVTDSVFELTLGDQINNLADQPTIDDVRYYSVVLTAAEVAAIYNEGENDVGAQKFSVTSPSTIQGAVGKSVSYQITTDAAYGMTGYNSSITYTLLNKPDWLDANIATGKVFGTPPSAGTYSFQAKATNTLGTGIKDVTITVSDYATGTMPSPSPPIMLDGSHSRIGTCWCASRRILPTVPATPGSATPSSAPMEATCALSPKQVRN